MSLLKKLVALSTVELIISQITPARDGNGNHIAILTLQDPIPHVRGSQELIYEGTSYPINADDVTEVKVHQRELELIDGDFKEQADGTFIYKGDKAILDVSQNKVVWLTTKSFQAAGREMSNNNRSQRVAKLVGIKPSDSVVMNGTAAVKPEAVAPVKPAGQPQGQQQPAKTA